LAPRRWSADGDLDVVPTGRTVRHRPQRSTALDCPELHRAAANGRC
jgi:hypothetical protein